jgi:hypothetical protein
VGIPLNLRHASTAKDRSPELANELIFVLRVVVGKVLLRPFEELPFPVLLAVQAEAHSAAIALLILVLKRPKASFP